MVVLFQGKSTKKTLMDSAIEIIRDEMAKQGISHTKMAEDLGIGRPYIYRVLARKQTPTMEWIEQVMEYLGVTIEIHFAKKS